MGLPNKQELFIAQQIFSCGDRVHHDKLVYKPRQNNIIYDEVDNTLNFIILYYTICNCPKVSVGWWGWWLIKANPILNGGRGGIMTTKLILPNSAKSKP